MDVSTTGLSLIAAEVFIKGTILNLTLDINEIEEAIEVKGKVLWQKKISKSFYQTSIKFTNLDDRNRAKILEFVNRVRIGK